MPASVFEGSLLAGRTALVTGGGTGICRGIALALAAHGCDVAIASRTIEHLEPTAAEIALTRCPLAGCRGRRSSSRRGNRRSRSGGERLRASRHPRERRSRQFRRARRRPVAQRLRHGGRHRPEGDVQRLAGRAAAPEGQSRGGAEHQRHAATARHHRTGACRGCKGRHRLDDPHPRRRSGVRTASA